MNLLNKTNTEMGTKSVNFIRRLNRGIFCLSNHIFDIWTWRFIGGGGG